MKEALLQRFVNNVIWSFRSGVNLEDPRRPIDGYTVSELLGGSPSKSGKSVNQDNALTVAAAWRAINILGGAVSSIPSKVYRKTSTGREVLKNYPAVDLLTNRPNKKYSTPVWFDRAINHLHLRGNHYALPKKNELGQVIELILINPDEVEVFEDVSDVFYRVNRDKTYSSQNFIHVPHLGTGIVGKSTISYAKDDLGIEMSRKDYSGTIYATGGRPPALLKPSQFLNAAQRAEVNVAWREAKQSGGDVVMPSGFDYQPLSFKPEEVEFLQSGNFSVATLARWFGVPRHKLFDPEGGSYNSNEQAAIEFLSDTIAPILVKFEYEYSSKLFQLPAEKRMYMEYDMNAYVRADTTTRFEAYAKGIHAAVMQPAEARSRENLPFIEGTDRNFINSGSVPLDLMDDFVKGKGKNLNANTVAKLKAKFNGQTQEILDILNE
jgi:HK97 family phage portal protein